LDIATHENQDLWEVFSARHNNRNYLYRHQTIVGGMLVKDNIFSVLYEWGGAREAPPENYYTKSLSFVLDRILRRDRQVGIDVLNSVLVNHLGFLLTSQEDSDITIEPHVSIQSEEGRRIPDICLESSKMLVRVEVKVDSPLDSRAIDALRSYKGQLVEEAGIRKKGLLLVTRSGQEDDKDSTDRQISWYDITSGLLRQLGKVGGRNEAGAADAVNLVEEFINFLKEQGMYIRRVPGQVGQDDMYNLLALLDMFKQGCTIAGLRKPTLETWFDVKEETDWIGYECNGDTYAFGIYREKDGPPSYYFEIRGIKDFLGAKRNTEIQALFDMEVEPWRNDDCIGIPLDLNGRGFFSLSEGEQLSTIQSFIKGILTNWEKAKGS
jgi:hypothetical protein